MQKIKNKKILLLDGETRSTLAAVRSLGKENTIAVASHLSNAISAKSRYSSYFFQSPHPLLAPETYDKWLLHVVEEWQPEILLPATDASMILVTNALSRLSKSVFVPVVQKTILDQISDKGLLAHAANQLRIKTPKTFLIPTVKEWTETTSKALLDFAYPAILKPRRSIIDLGGRMIQPKMHYAKSPEEVIEVIQNAENNSEGTQYMLQEKIDGIGLGVSCLAYAGETLMAFAHKRILEKPPSGGRSVLSESLALEDSPVEEAKILLRHFNWSGVAMIEFKQNEQGENYLIEINPRFWGSMQLAIDCGCDFPNALCSLFEENNNKNPQDKYQFQYAAGQRLRWELGTLDHCFIRLKSNPLFALKEIFRQNALHCFSKNKTNLEIFRKDDPMPFLREIKNYF
jgi:predicted ATP-grasp superfamily ATP-dependent carboligase